MPTGPARARVIGTLAAALALNGADTSTVGAIAPQLEGALHVGATEIGLLISVGLLVGAVATIPVGLLVDRSRRVPILAVSIVLWSIASLAAAFAGSYSSLLLTRAALGAVTATAAPVIASLTGDFFPARERGRVYAYILSGEVAGSAVGYIVSGLVASLIDWRAAFLVLAAVTNAGGGVGETGDEQAGDDVEDVVVTGRDYRDGHQRSDGGASASPTRRAGRRGRRCRSRTPARRSTWMIQADRRGTRPRRRDASPFRLRAATAPPPLVMPALDRWRRGRHAVYAIFRRLGVP
jgi:hypothetical protein